MPQGLRMRDNWVTSDCLWELSDGGAGERNHKLSHSHRAGKALLGHAKFGTAILENTDRSTLSGTRAKAVSTSACFPEDVIFLQL